MLYCSISGTGARKHGVDLREVVALAAWILQLYGGVDPSDQQLLSKISEDLDIIWESVIFPMLHI